MLIQRGDIYFANLHNEVKGSEQGGPRPVVVLQNNLGNKFSPTIIVAVFTTKVKKAKLPTHIEFPASEFKLHEDSLLMLEQIKTVSKMRITSYISSIKNNKLMLAKLDEALNVSLGMQKAFSDTLAKQNYRRGDVYLAKLEDNCLGSEQGGERHVMILQNDIGNRYAPTVIVGVFSNKNKKAKLPTHVEFGTREFGLMDDSVLMLEHVKTIDKGRLKNFVTHIANITDKMLHIDEALRVSMGLTESLFIEKKEKLVYKM